MTGAPLEQISKTVAALTFGEVVLPVSRALDGAIPLVALMHLSAGTLMIVRRTRRPCHRANVETRRWPN
jgi:hypothetical protein